MTAASRRLTATGRALVIEIERLLTRGLDTDTIAHTVIARELRAKDWAVADIARALRQPVERIARLVSI